MKVIFSRELRSYFQTMLGPVFIAVLTAVTGVYFMVTNLINGYPYFAATLGSLLFMLMVAVPILTMKSFAEDRHSHAEQLMLSAPVTVWDIVLGKYFAMAAVFAIPCLLFCLCPLIIQTGGTASLGSDWAAIGLYFLLGCAYIAIGMFLSSLTESQLIAAVSSFGVLLVLYLWDALAGYFPTSARGNLVDMLVLTALLAGLYSQAEFTGEDGAVLAESARRRAEDAFRVDGLEETVLLWNRDSLDLLFWSRNAAGQPLFEDREGTLTVRSNTGLVRVLPVGGLGRQLMWELRLSTRPGAGEEG